MTRVAGSGTDDVSVKRAKLNPVSSVLSNKSALTAVWSTLSVDEVRKGLMCSPLKTPNALIYR